MRKPEPLHARDKTGNYVLDKKGERKVIAWQIRFPKPGGGMNYRRFKTKREAELESARIEQSRAGGAVLDVGVRWEEAIARFKREHYIGLKPSAVHDYDRAFRRIDPYLKGRRICDISTKFLRDWRDEEAKRIRDTQRAISARAIDGIKKQKKKDPERLAELESKATRIDSMGARTTNKVLGAMQTFLKFCRQEGYCSANAAEDVKRLKVQTGNDLPTREAVFTPQEIARAVQAADDHWQAALLVLFYGGLRLGELLGLSWRDVELGASRLLVRQQLCGTTGEIRAPKTKASQRFVSLPPFVVSALRAWKIACPPGPLELVFPAINGNPMDQHNFHKRAWKPALRRAGLRHIRVHDARHTCASLLIATGADIASISRQLGHANVAITLGTYTHWIARRAESDLGAKLAALVEAEGDGCGLVVSEVRARRKSTQVVVPDGGPAWIRTKDQGIMSPLH